MKVANEVRIALRASECLFGRDLGRSHTQRWSEMRCNSCVTAPAAAETSRQWPDVCADVKLKDKAHRDAVQRGQA
jgi:hypothetical protein